MATWTLGEALESALASILNEVGEGVSAATDPDAAMSKKRPSRSPAKFQEIVSCDTALPVQEVDTDKERRIATASPKAGMGRPSPAVRRSLFVIVEGGRPAQGGGVKPGGLRTDPVEVRAREWKVVMGGRHAALL